MRLFISFARAAVSHYYFKVNESGEKQFGESDERVPKRVFVEVGTNIIPVPFIGGKSFEHDTYIGVDVKEENARKARENSDHRFASETKNIFFLNADAKKLPLADDSVDELYMGNLIGDPGVTQKEKEIFFKEASRVLKNEGRLVVKETNTPYPVVPDPSEQVFINQSLEELIKKSDFVVEKFVNSADPEWPSVAAPYDRVTTKAPLRFHKDWHYIVFLRKKLPVKSV